MADGTGLVVKSWSLAGWCARQCKQWVRIWSWSKANERAVRHVKDGLDGLLEKHSQWKVQRNFSWIVRFIRNRKLAKRHRVHGPPPAKNCIKSLKRFIAKNGRANRIYSDNGRTFVAPVKWITKIVKNEQAQNFLGHQNITWLSSLSTALKKYCEPSEKSVIQKHRTSESEVEWGGCTG